MGFYWVYNLFSPLHLSYTSIHLLSLLLCFQSLTFSLCFYIFYIPGTSKEWKLECEPEVKCLVLLLGFSSSAKVAWRPFSVTLSPGLSMEYNLQVSGSCNKLTTAASACCSHKWPKLSVLIPRVKQKLLHIYKPLKGAYKREAPICGNSSHRRWSASCPGYFGYCESFPGGFLSLARQQLLLLSKLPPYISWENTTVTIWKISVPHLPIIPSNSGLKIISKTFQEVFIPFYFFFHFSILSNLPNLLPFSSLLIGQLFYLVFVCLFLQSMYLCIHLFSISFISHFVSFFT